MECSLAFHMCWWALVSLLIVGTSSSQAPMFSDGLQLYKAALREALSEVRCQLGQEERTRLAEQLFYKVNDAAAQAGLNTNNLEALDFYEVAKNVQHPEFRLRHESYPEVEKKGDRYYKGSAMVQDVKWPEHVDLGLFDRVLERSPINKDALSMMLQKEWKYHEISSGDLNSLLHGENVTLCSMGWSISKSYCQKYIIEDGEANEMRIWLEPFSVALYIRDPSTVKPLHIAINYDFSFPFTSPAGTSHEVSLSIPSCQETTVALPAEVHFFNSKMSYSPTATRSIISILGLVDAVESGTSVELDFYSNPITVLATCKRSSLAVKKSPVIAISLLDQGKTFQKSMKHLERLKQQTLGKAEEIKRTILDLTDANTESYVKVRKQLDEEKLAKITDMKKVMEQALLSNGPLLRAIPTSVKFDVLEEAAKQAELSKEDVFPASSIDGREMIDGMLAVASRHPTIVSKYQQAATLMRYPEDFLQVVDVFFRQVVASRVLQQARHQNVTIWLHEPQQNDADLDVLTFVDHEEDEYSFYVKFFQDEEGTLEGWTASKRLSSHPSGFGRSSDFLVVPMGTSSHTSAASGRGDLIVTSIMSFLGMQIQAPTISETTYALEASYATLLSVVERDELGLYMTSIGDVVKAIRTLDESTRSLQLFGTMQHLETRGRLLQERSERVTDIVTESVSTDLDSTTGGHSTTGGDSTTGGYSTSERYAGTTEGFATDDSLFENTTTEIIMKAPGGNAAGQLVTPQDEEHDVRSTLRKMWKENPYSFEECQTFDNLRKHDRVLEFAALVFEELMRAPHVEAINFKQTGKKLTRADEVIGPRVNYEPTGSVDRKKRSTRVCFVPNLGKKRSSNRRTIISMQKKLEDVAKKARNTLAATSTKLKTMIPSVRTFISQDNLEKLDSPRMDRFADMAGVQGAIELTTTAIAATAESIRSNLEEFQMGQINNSVLATRIVRDVDKGLGIAGQSLAGLGLSYADGLRVMPMSSSAVLSSIGVGLSNVLGPVLLIGSMGYEMYTICDQFNRNEITREERGVAIARMGTKNMLMAGTSMDDLALALDRGPVGLALMGTAAALAIILGDNKILGDLVWKALLGDQSTQPGTHDHQLLAKTLEKAYAMFALTGKALPAFELKAAYTAAIVRFHPDKAQSKQHQRDQNSLITQAVVTADALIEEHWYLTAAYEWLGVSAPTTDEDFHREYHRLEGHPLGGLTKQMYKIIKDSRKKYQPCELFGLPASCNKDDILQKAFAAEPVKTINNKKSNNPFFLRASLLG